VKRRDPENPFRATTFHPNYSDYWRWQTTAHRTLASAAKRAGNISVLWHVQACPFRGRQHASVGVSR